MENLLLLLRNCLVLTLVLITMINVAGDGASAKDSRVESLKSTVSRGDQRLTIGIGPSYSYFINGGTNEPKGGGVNATLRYRLTDAWEISSAFLWTAHRVTPVEQAEQTTHSIAAHLGVTYLVDINRFSPSIELGVGVFHYIEQLRQLTRASARAAVAIDYEWLPSLAIGIVAAYHVWLSNPNDRPVFIELGPRLSWFFSL